MEKANLKDTDLCPNCGEAKVGTFKKSYKVEKENRVKYQDAGYGDDDTYADFYYRVVYGVCPKCQKEIHLNQTYLGYNNEKTRYGNYVNIEYWDYTVLGTSQVLDQKFENECFRKVYKYQEAPCCGNCRERFDENKDALLYEDRKDFCRKCKGHVDKWFFCSQYHAKDQGAKKNENESD